MLIKQKKNIKYIVSGEIHYKNKYLWNYVSALVDGMGWFCLWDLLQSLHLPGEVMQHQLAELSPLIGGIRKYRHISLLILSFLMPVLHYSFTLEICQCLFASLVMNLIKWEDNDWKIPAPLHHLPGVNIEVNYGLELPHTHISRNNYKNIEQSRGVSGLLITIRQPMDLGQKF